MQKICKDKLTSAAAPSADLFPPKMLHFKRSVVFFCDRGLLLGKKLYNSKPYITAFFNLPLGADYCLSYGISVDGSLAHFQMIVPLLPGS